MTPLRVFQRDGGPAARPDPGLPLDRQLDLALAQTAEHGRTARDTQATCSHLHQVGGWVSG